MSRGVVLWPDDAAGGTVRKIWDAIAEAGIPSLATLTHRLHEPHVSLIVAEDLPVDDALDAVVPVPARPLPLSIESLGVFPQGVLFLSCVPTPQLLDEQRRVQEAVRPIAVSPWPYFEPGSWVPHITLAVDLADDQLAAALPIVARHLPIRGALDRGGVEDGSTGESWAGPSGRETGRD